MPKRNLLSDDAQWEAFGTRALYHTTYGGADFGECMRAAEGVASGDSDAWHRSWTSIADELVEVARASERDGHAVSAREAYIRAATYYRTGYAPLFGGPPDERLLGNARSEREALAAAVALWEPAADLVEIPFEGTTLPGVLMTAGPGRRPTIVHVNGYDSTIAEMTVAHGPAAIARGYNILLFDGPGQGRNLFEHDMHIRPEWETVVTPVVDWVLRRDDVDPDRVVLAGWSFGGLLAARAAGVEQRIAALVVDPRQWDQRELVLSRLPLPDEDKERFPDVDPAPFTQMEAWLRSPEGDPGLRWTLLQRGRWVHGVDTLFDYFVDLSRFEVSSVAGDIRCPTLVAAAETDPAAANAPKLYDAIASERKQLVRFTAAEGAGGHCEGTARRVFHQRVYDWLDEALAA